MAKIKQKPSMLGIIMGIVVLAMCAISVTGLAIDEWTVYEVNTAHVDTEDLEKLFNMSQPFGDYSDSVIGEEGEKIEDIEISFDTDDPAAVRTTMVVFGYIAVIAVCALALLYLLKMVVNVGLMRFLVGILGIVTLAAGAVLTAMTAIYCDSTTIFVSFPFIGEIDLGLALGVGAYLSCIGTMAGGLSAVIGVARK